jgi:hypothetical protein
MKNNNNSGTYIVDKKTGKVVKVSDNIPSAKKSGGHVCGGGCCCGCSHNEN